MTLSLFGPWGTGKISTLIRVTFEFPTSYPKYSAPRLKIEKGASLTKDAIDCIIRDASVISSAFLTSQWSSAECLVRFLIGERSLEQCLQASQKHRANQELGALLDRDPSSSDDDNEHLAEIFDAVEAENQSLAANRTPYALPLPKVCGGVWARNGMLVCFFPPKQKEASLLEHGRGQKGLKTRINIFEGFGKIHDTWRDHKPGHDSGFESNSAEISGDDDYSTSSSDSSLSTNPTIPHPYFLPALGWQGEGLDPYTKLSLDESQKSSGEAATANSTMSKSAVSVSFHDFRNLLPAKELLARGYRVDHGDQAAHHNAQIARSCGFPELEDVWMLLTLLMRDEVPLESLRPARAGEPIVLLVHRALSRYKSMKNAVDLAYDADSEANITLHSETQWGLHPLGKGWLIESLFKHFEGQSDVQMLAMMSCVLTGFSSTKDKVCGQSIIADQRQIESRMVFPYHLSAETARSLDLPPMQADLDSISNIRSTGSSTVASMVNQNVLSSQSMTAPGNSSGGKDGDRRSSYDTSLSTSPDHHRQAARSNSSFSGISASFSRPFHLSHSAASSPPNRLSRKRPSPTGSYLGGALANISLTPTESFLRKSSTKAGIEKSSLSFSGSDIKERLRNKQARKTTFSTKLKHQDKFFTDGGADSTLLATSDDAKHGNYREAYAQVLDAWQLHVKRCEVLKHNRFDKVAPPNLPFASGHNRRRHLDDAPNSTGNPSSLQFYQKCSYCDQGLVTSSINPSNHCPRCKRYLRSPVCALCHSYVYGLSSPCLRCFHTLHPRCRSALVQLQPDKPRRVASYCPAGCGCICADESPLTISSFNPATDYSEFSQRLIATYRGSHARDVSPAVTVVEAGESSSAAGQTADSQSGFGHKRQRSDVSASSSSPTMVNMTGVSTPKDRQSENVDLAYESLARNLKAGSGAAAVAGHRFGVGLREKGSQIWRGG